MPDAKFYPFTNGMWQSTQGIIQAEMGQLGQDGTDPAALLADMQKKVEEQ